MDETKDYLWLVKTDKGDFFFSVMGKWTQEEAAAKVRQVLDLIKLNIVGMIPRKRVTGGWDMTATIYEQLEPKTGLGFEVNAGAGIWEACGRGTDYQAQKILMEKELSLEREKR